MTNPYGVRPPTRLDSSAFADWNAANQAARRAYNADMAATERYCPCGAVLGPRRQRCDTCRVENPRRYNRLYYGMRGAAA